MESKLQELTNKLYNEGVEKANKEAQRILEEAKKEADKTKKEAREKAQEIIDDAKQEAEDLKKNVESELNLAATQTMREVKKGITEMISEKAVKKPVKEALGDKEFMKKIIESTIKNWQPKKGEKTDVVVTIPKNMEKELNDYLENKMANELNAGITVQVSDKMKGGFSIGPSDGAFKITFSEKDFENFFKAYLRPRTVEMLFDKEKESNEK
ncbi:MAG: hypothetical protein R6U04_06740 [Bacteroidales bacterium]